MAEGLLRARFGRRAPSGVQCRRDSDIHGPDAIRVMAEMGIDISGQWSKSLEDVREIGFDVVVTVCDGAQGVVSFLFWIGSNLELSPETTRKMIS